MEPLLISKVNTTAQFSLVTLVLGLHGYAVFDSTIIDIMVYIVAATTVMSGTIYVGIWGMRAARTEPGE